LSKVSSKKYIGGQYEGTNCLIPKTTVKTTLRESLTTSISLILTQRYKSFLYKNSGDLRGGIMTLSKISAFNKYMSTNIVYYNSKDRHTYPKGITNNDEMILYLHKEHFCLINKKNKKAGVDEIEANYNKHVMYTRVNNKNIKELGNFEVNRELVDCKVFTWDLETYPNLQNDRWCDVYAAGIFPLDKIEDVQNNSEPVDEETKETLMNEAKTFSGIDSITNMLKHL
jgi:DNA polymerase III delta prime subunit